MNHSTLIILNPVAGMENATQFLSTLVEKLSESGEPVLCYATGKSGDAALMARRYGNQVDQVITLGGDGTLSEVTEGLLFHEQRPIVGYIPAGTSNDFASGLGLSDQTEEELVQTALFGVPMACDMGLFNGTSFLYVAAFGAFTTVSYQTPQAKKNVLGRFAYLVEGMKELSGLTEYEIEMRTDSQTFRGKYLLGMISNSNTVAGMVHLDASTDYQDGLFEVTLVKAGYSALDYAALARELMNGELTHEACLHFQTSYLEVRSPLPIAWTLDGEEGDETTKATIQVLPRALRIRTKVAPKEERK